MTDRTGIAIDPATNDLFMDGTNNLAMVFDAEAVGQHVRQRVMTFEGEWFLDTLAGLPWIAQIFGKSYDPALAEAVVKAEILETDGASGIEGFSIRFDRETRGVIIKDITVETPYGTAAI